MKFLVMNFLSRFFVSLTPNILIALTSNSRNSSWSPFSHNLCFFYNVVHYSIFKPLVGVRVAHRLLISCKMSIRHVFTDGIVRKDKVMKNDIRASKLRECIRAKVTGVHINRVHFTTLLREHGFFSIEKGGAGVNVGHEISDLGFFFGKQNKTN